MRITIAALAAITAAGVTFLTTTPAMAQDGAAAFTGPWVAAIAGGDRLQGGNDHDDGVTYGVQAGYDFALGTTMRAGIELETADSTQKQCRSGTIRGGDRLCVEAARDLYIGGRVGTLIGDRTMLYAKAGYTNARGEVRYRSGLATGSFSDADNADGVRAGIGLEHRLGGKAFAKVEYRYSNYQAGSERHQALVGFGVRF